MILERDIPRESLSSLKAVYGGSGELEEELQQRFEDRYGVPLHWGYGATEFGGSLVSWSEALRNHDGKVKPGSSGCVLPGLSARITDPENETVLGPNEKGRLEALVPTMGDDWIATNDLASIDKDGFVYIYGRMDGAINRGGFKIHPEAIATALRAHPAMCDAAAFGGKDSRLGQIPLAAIELIDGMPAPETDELMNMLREKLPAQSIPIRIERLDALPRTPSLKVDLALLREVCLQPAVVAN
ncbi:class I adenylate-forming enzyme family protein [Rhizorhapis sp. SPR117]|uniref:class I adenylate-forming enzyme family protein n=1 Tax=Rhizorhapis sp. SPR117 TaxID=2912611 RepID=UPI001F3E07D4|nr:fatty acid--CoA ligase family protein [Rhizorhapis sp. SPR117]